jgi:hypothetical protein
MTLAADEFIGNMHIFKMTPRDLHLGVHISPGSKQNHLRANKMSHLPDHKSLLADHHCVNQCLCYTNP